MATTIEFQLLWHAVSIEMSAASPIVAERMRYLTSEARHGFEPVASMNYSIESYANGHRIFEDGDALPDVDDADQVLDVTYQRIHGRAFELASLRGWVRLHAATVDLPAGRLLIAARSGTGKTTLACVLRRAGVDVPADESVLVRRGMAIPVARRFHLKTSILDVLPELRQVAESAPRSEPAGIAAVDPRQLGGHWSIEQRPVTALVVLERSSITQLSQMSSIEALPLLVEESFRNQETVSEVLNAIASVARDASCYLLRLAAPSEALDQLRSI